MGRDEDDDLASYEDNPRTFPREGWGEEIDPAASGEEWADSTHDQLDEAADIDDPVEALEEGALSAATEAGPGDSTELADIAAPPPPEEAALRGLPADRLEAEDALTVGLPPGTDLADLPYEALAEAELVAISEGEPELAAILADELARRKRGS